MFSRDRQGYVLRWVEDTFGRKAINSEERGARLVEESIELAQVCGLTIDDVDAISKRVFARKPGFVEQEIGGVQITLEALAEFFGLDVNLLANDELYRIMRLPPEYFARKYADKQSAGILHFKGDGE